MTWSEIIAHVAKALARPADGSALATLIERAEAGSYAEEDVRAVVDDGAGQGPFLEALDQALRAHHRDWSPELLAQARAGMLVLPELLSRLRRIQSGRPMAPASVRSVLQRLERAAMQNEPPAMRDRKCPRCGSSRVDTRRTTVFGTNHYEQRCEACGHIEEWDEGVALGEAMTEARRK
jgi:hypothetical protein